MPADQTHDDPINMPFELTQPRPRTMQKFLLLAFVFSLFTAGCNSTISQDDARESESAKPTARRVIDGVETWDLTVTPSREAFGLAPDRDVRIYETGSPRTVRLLFPNDVELTVRVRYIDFTAFSDRWSWSIRTPAHRRAELINAYGDLLKQRGMNLKPVAAFEALIDAADPESLETINSENFWLVRGSPYAAGGAHFGPASKIGAVTLGGYWDEK